MTRDFSTRIGPPTKDIWDAASPHTKGYLTYMFAEWPDSEIPKKSPFKKHTDEQVEFEAGQLLAMQHAQDSEE